MKKLLFLFFFGALMLGANAQYWNTGGNAVGTTDFIGTLNNLPLIFKAGNIEWMWLTRYGELGIGTDEPDAPFHLQVANPHVSGKLLQIGAGVDGVNGNLVLRSDPEKKSMALEYETNGEFSIDGVRGGIRLNPAGTVEVYKNYVPSHEERPYTFKVFGGALFTANADMLSLNAQTANISGTLSAQNASISETLTAHILMGKAPKLPEMLLWVEIWA